MSNLLRMVAVMCVLAFTASCAPANADKLSALEQRIEAALSAANSAGEKADRALSIASEASYAADQAQSTAESALRCCNENSDKIERAFERVTQK